MPLQRANSSPLQKLPGASSQRQNTTFYSTLPDSEREQQRLLRLMIKMLHYLPEMHEFFKFSPTKLIVRGQNALLTNRVSPIVFASSSSSSAEH